MSELTFQHHYSNLQCHIFMEKGFFDEQNSIYLK